MSIFQDRLPVCFPEFRFSGVDVFFFRDWHWQSSFSGSDVLFQEWQPFVQELFVFFSASPVFFYDRLLFFSIRGLSSRIGWLAVPGSVVIHSCRIECLFPGLDVYFFPSCVSYVLCSQGCGHIVEFPRFQTNLKQLANIPVYNCT